MKVTVGFLLAFCAAIQGSQAQLSIGANCGHPVTQFCNRATGLICGDEFKCACSHGPVATGLEYQLEWDTTLGKCVAQPDTPCFRPTGVPAPGTYTTTCVPNYECVELKALPPGVGLCKPQITLLTHGAPCNKDTFCNKAAGLICNQQFQCGCSHGTVTHELEYKFEWNATAGKCLAEEGSACHTSEDVSVAQCGGDLICAQIEGGVPGIGVCQADGSGQGNSAVKVAFNLGALVFSVTAALAILL